MLHQKDSSLLRFVQSAESMTHREDVLQGFLAQLEPIGFKYLIYVTTDQNKTDRYVWSNVGIHEHPDANDFLDPFLDYCCSSYSPTYTGVSFLNDYPYLNERERAFIRSAGEEGFKSGIGLPVSLDNRMRYGGFNLGTALNKSAFLNSIPAKEGMLAHACVLLNRTLEALPHGEEPQSAFPPLSTLLTKRELGILHHLSGGLSRKEIARQTDLTPNTINSYVKAIYSKIGVSNRVQATRVAIQAGLHAPEN